MYSAIQELFYGSYSASDLPTSAVPGYRESLPIPSSFPSNCGRASAKSRRSFSKPTARTPTRATR